MGARIVCVGDPNQSLYRFRGADSRAFERIAEMLAKNCRPIVRKELPINYRCDQAIIKHCQQWVPSLMGNSKAIGTVGSMSFNEAMKRANNDLTDIMLSDGIDGADRTLPLPGKKEVSFAFLCRINLPLVITAYQLIGRGKRCCIIGRAQIGAPLIQIINTLCGTEPDQEGFTNRLTNRKDSDGDIIEEGFLLRLRNYHRMQAQKLSGEGFENKLEALNQNVECLEVICERIMDDKVSTLREEIETLFVEDAEPGVIALSTIHRAKGLEWDVVFILRPDLMPHPLAKANPDGSWSDEQQQEQNAQYVAWTRARNRIYAINDWPFGKSRSTRRSTLRHSMPEFVDPIDSPDDFLDEENHPNHLEDSRVINPDWIDDLAPF